MEKVKESLYVEYNNLVRCVAIICVVMVHASAYGLTNEKIDCGQRMVLTFYNLICRIAVPLFVMIAGAIWLNLKRNVSLDRLIHKNIKKLVVTFFMWSWVYAIAYLIGTGAEWKFGLILLFLKRCLIGHYHMWYLQMMIVLYLMIPLIRQIIQKEELHRLLWVMSFITGFVFPLARRVPVIDWTAEIMDNMSVCTFSCYLFYFLLGDYIRRNNCQKKYRIAIYVVSIIAGLVRFFISYLQNKGYGLEYLEVYNNDDLLLLLQVTGVYIFLKNINQYCKENRIIDTVSKYSFFIYLSHDLILEILYVFGINTSIMTAWIIAPCIVAFVLVICIILGHLLAKRKWFQKYYF